jgi:hypothetical protein
VKALGAHHCAGGCVRGGDRSESTSRGQEGTFRGRHVGALRALEGRFLGMFRWLWGTLEGRKRMRERVGTLKGWLV